MIGYPRHAIRLEALGKVLRREIKARVHAHRADDMLTAIRIADILTAKGFRSRPGRSFFPVKSTS